MSGGVAYVYDEDASFAKRCNTSMVTLEKLVSSEPSSKPRSTARCGTAQGRWRAETDEAILKKLIEDHHRWTGSQRARHPRQLGRATRQVRQGVPERVPPRARRVECAPRRPRKPSLRPRRLRLAKVLRNDMNDHGKSHWFPWSSSAWKRATRPSPSASRTTKSSSSA